MEETGTVVEKTFSEKRQAVLDAIISLDNTELLGYAEDVLKKAKKGSGIKKDSVFQQFKALIIEKGEISEFEMYAKFRAGKHESLTLCRQLRTRVPDGEPMIWAQDTVGKATNPFTGEEEDAVIYKVLGTGTEQPEDYIVRRQRKPVVAETPEAEETAENIEAEIDLGIDIS